MSKFASIVRRPKNESKPSIGTLLHNQRIATPKNLLPTKYRLKNYHLNKITNVTKVFKNWELENETRYAKINGRKLRSDAHRLESLVIVLSGKQVATQNPDDIWQKAKEFKIWFEKKYKTKVQTMDWHRDEGHVKNKIAKINDHIHLEFNNVNSEGKMVRKLFSKGDLIAFQDQISEIYKPLGFVRGQNTQKTSNTSIPKRGIPQKQFRIDQMQKSAKQNLAKQKDLKAEIKRLKTELQTKKAKRKDYAKLEQLNKDLKADITDKNLTINQMIHKLKNFEALPLQNQALKEQNQALKTKIATLPSLDTFEELNTLKNDFQALQQINTNTQKQLSVSLSKISKFEEQNQAFRARIKTQKIEISEITKELDTAKNTNTQYQNTIKSLGQLLQKFYTFIFGKTPSNQSSIQKINEDLDAHIQKQKLQKIKEHDVTKVPTLLEQIEKKEAIEIQIEKNEDITNSIKP